MFLSQFSVALYIFPLLCLCLHLCYLPIYLSPYRWTVLLIIEDGVGIMYLLVAAADIALTTLQGGDGHLNVAGFWI